MRATKISQRSLVFQACPAVPVHGRHRMKAAQKPCATRDALSYLHQGRKERLTEIHGNVMQQIV
jgi:hypothetical protein